MARPAHPEAASRPLGGARSEMASPRAPRRRRRCARALTILGGEKGEMARPAVWREDMCGAAGRDGKPSAREGRASSESEKPQERPYLGGEGPLQRGKGARPTVSGRRSEGARPTGLARVQCRLYNPRLAERPALKEVSYVHVCTQPVLIRLYRYGRGTSVVIRSPRPLEDTAGPHRQTPRQMRG